MTKPRYSECHHLNPWWLAPFYDYIMKQIWPTNIAVYVMIKPHWVTYQTNKFKLLNLLCTTDVIWRAKSGSILTQAMACCHLAASHGPLTRYVKLQVAHAPGMPGTFSPAADFKENRLLAIPACITARAWRTCRDACRDRLHVVTGKTFPAHAYPQF